MSSTTTTASSPTIPTSPTTLTTTNFITTTTATTTGSSSFGNRLYHRFRAVLHLLLLQSFIPISLFFVLSHVLLLLWWWWRRHSSGWSNGGCCGSWWRASNTNQHQHHEDVAKNELVGGEQPQPPPVVPNHDDDDKIEDNTKGVLVTSSRVDEEHKPTCSFSENDKDNDKKKHRTSSSSNSSTASLSSSRTITDEENSSTMSTNSSEEPLGVTSSSSSSSLVDVVSSILDEKENHDSNNDKNEIADTTTDNQKNHETLNNTRRATTNSSGTTTTMTLSVDQKRENDGVPLPPSSFPDCDKMDTANDGYESSTSTTTRSSASSMMELESEKQKKKEYPMNDHHAAIDTNHTTTTTTNSTLPPSHQSKTKNNHYYSVVLTGGKMSKTLHLMRCLRAYADSDDNNVTMKITVLEQAKFRYCHSRFSRCVDAFVVITSPRHSPHQYQEDIYQACRQANATHFLPVAAPVEAVYDAQLQPRLERDLKVKVLHVNLELCRILDDKHQFGCFVRNVLQIRSPRTIQVESNEQVLEWNDRLQQQQNAGKLPRPMILKNLSYDPVHRLDLFQLPTTAASRDKLVTYLHKIAQDGNPITPQQPWQLQEFLWGGQEYAAMVVVRSNQLVAMTCCPSSASQLNYVHVDVPAVRSWLDDFMTALRTQTKHVLTGQLCFDFIVVDDDDDHDGKQHQVAYPIECNPRVHTQCVSYNRPDVRALFGELLLQDSPPPEEEVQQLAQMLERDYNNKKCRLKDDNDSDNDVAKQGKKAPQKYVPDRNVYWFYNEVFKLMPYSWLLKYSDDNNDNNATSHNVEDDDQNHDLPHASTTTKKATTKTRMDYWMDCLLFLYYLPALTLSLIMALPVLVILFVGEWLLALTTTTNNNPNPSSSSEKTRSSYTTAVVQWMRRVAHFAERVRYLEQHVEGDTDLWSKHHDWWPFLVKNHVQVPTRLCATIRTGVEWKKIDFAIGKVVEVGGD